VWLRMSWRVRGDGPARSCTRSSRGCDATDQDAGRPAGPFHGPAATDGQGPCELSAQAQDAAQPHRNGAAVAEVTTAVRLAWCGVGGAQARTPERAASPLSSGVLRPETSKPRMPHRRGETAWLAWRNRRPGGEHSRGEREADRDEPPHRTARHGPLWHARLSARHWVARMLGCSPSRHQMGSPGRRKKRSLWSGIPRASSGSL
jgi:hypothetical protein